MSFEGYTMNRLGQYAYTQGYIRGVLKSGQSDSQKLNLIAIELKELDERLEKIKEMEKKL